MTIAKREVQWLYLRETFTVRVEGVPDGVTIEASWSELQDGAPDPIGTLVADLTLVSGTTHGYDFSRDDLLEQMTTAGLTSGRKVYLHLDDGVSQRDVWPFKLTDRDPDLLGPCPQT